MKDKSFNQQICVLTVKGRHKVCVKGMVIQMTEKELEPKKDIFDKIMGWGFLKIFEPFYKKNKEVLMYLFFGVLTTVVSFLTAGLSKFLLEKIGTGDTVVAFVSTCFSWVCAVTFAYLTNRVWVFGSQVSDKKGLFTEALSFYGGRVFTLIVEAVMMWLGYSLMGLNYWVTKIIANVVVLVLNYVISKLLVFRNKN